MKKIEAKKEAQDFLMGILATAKLQATERNFSPEVIAAVSAEFRKLEKKFGYEPNSWIEE